MHFLNYISHPNKLTQEKVIFFADYYNYAASQIEKIDSIDPENYLSLIEKIIFQINTNPDNCNKYIDSYLTHPLLQKGNKYFKEFKNYGVVIDLFENYKNSGKPQAKSIWIRENPVFKLTLVKFSTELKKFMFRKSLKSIVIFLKCTHPLSSHKEDLIHHTNILVTEFLYAGWTKEDIIETFPKIITAQINEYPFSNSFVKANKSNLKKAKEKHFENRSFDDQFDGILNYLRAPFKNEYYIFRVLNINAFKGFKFKYNQVTFYDNDNPKLKNLKLKIKESGFSKNFFKKENMILAVVKVRAKSKRIGEQTAINIIRKELTFLNSTYSANTLLEPFSYITTVDFKDFRSKWSAKENSVSISENSKSSFEKNPFLLLKGANKNCAEHFLCYEYLFIKAKMSGNAEDYWHYFETLLKVCNESTGNMIAIISNIMWLSSTRIEKQLIEIYIINSFSNASPEEFNLSRNEYYKIRNVGLDDVDEIIKNIRHPFINQLAKKRSKPVNKLYLKSYYSRLLWECYSQRNSMMHNNEQNEKALISIGIKLPQLALRFRETLIDSMINNNVLNFIQLIEKLKE